MTRTIKHKLKESQQRNLIQMSPGYDVIFFLYSFALLRRRINGLTCILNRILLNTFAFFFQNDINTCCIITLNNLQ